MKDVGGVEVLQPLEDLIHEKLNMPFRQGLRELDNL